MNTNIILLLVTVIGSLPTIASSHGDVEHLNDRRERFESFRTPLVQTFADRERARVKMENEMNDLMAQRNSDGIQESKTVHNNNDMGPD